MTSLLRPGDLVTAMTLLTRLPVGRADLSRSAEAAWAWPLVGLPVAALGLLAGGVAGALGAPPAAMAGAVLVATVMATGALHEDGLADSADGLWGGATPQRRLEIMRDSRIGTFGALALILGTGLRWSLVAAHLAAGALAGPLVAAAVLSRAAMLGVMRALPPARADGLARGVGRPPAAAAAIGIGAAGVISLAIGGAAPLAAALIGASAVGLLARARIGGQTGDVLGAAQQVAEIAVLLVLL